MLQVLTFTAVVMPNQDLAFMGAIAWTALNLLLSNFMMRYVDIGQAWFSQLRYAWRRTGRLVSVTVADCLACGSELNSAMKCAVSSGNNLHLWPCFAVGLEVCCGSLSTLQWCVAVHVMVMSGRGLC